MKHLRGIMPGRHVKNSGFHQHLAQQGLCLVVPSEILVIVARLQLGGSFSVRAEARSLVAHGLYSRIQNPIYLFGGVTLAGLILFLDRPWYLIAFLIVIPMQLFRIRREREVLTKKFGE